MKDVLMCQLNFDTGLDPCNLLFSIDLGKEKIFAAEKTGRPRRSRQRHLHFTDIHDKGPAVENIAVRITGV